jgi:transposase
MAYLGLTPSEYSSGSSVRRGGMLASSLVVEFRR